MQRARTAHRARADRRESARVRREASGAARAAAVAEKAEAKLWGAYQRARRTLDARNAAAPSGAAASASGAHARSDAARNALVEHYQPLVRVIAAALERRLPRSVDRADLEIAGTVGLMSAIEAYDATRGVPFELYAEHRLRGALLDELRVMDRVPRPWRARLEARRRTIERLRADLGREPWDDEVASALGIPLQEYQQDYVPALVDAPMSPTWGEDAGASAGPTLDAVADQAREGPGERLTRDDLLRLVAQKLSVQEYRLVYLKYWEDMPLREIGVALGLSESRVCKIHMALLDRLRDKLAPDPRDR